MLLRAATFALMYLLACPSAAKEDKPIRLILVGDSTMATRTGYGDTLCQRLPATATCINLARGGRSSGSFRAEGRWDQVQALLRDRAPYARTYVLIQFGHNDQPGKPGRSTDLVTEFPRNMTQYVADTRALGATPVLLTPLTRRSFRGPWLHNDLAPWAASTRAVARTTGSALLDLNALSAQAVQAMGTREADQLAQEGAFDHTHLGARGATLFSGIVARAMKRLFPQLPLSEQDPIEAPPSRSAAPAGGWAAMQGGTRAGSLAHGDQTYTVTTAAELREAVARKDNASKVIKIVRTIDMRGATPFASTADQAARGTLRLGSNTTLIGIGPDAGMVNANVVIADATQVIVRNLHFQNPCDVGPVWDPQDGAKGNWNSQFDSIVVSNSTHVWIDHNTFTDSPVTDDTLAMENGMRKQCHDGALDINRGSDFVTVSYNRFRDHEKNILVGSSDRASGDDGHLRVTFHDNWFDNVGARSPRVRFGQVHVYNNYYAGSRRHPVYPHEYSIGVGKQAKIIATNNAFDIEGARECKHIVHVYDSTASHHDTGSILNGAALACPSTSGPAWRVPYPYQAKPATEVRSHVMANAGAGQPLAHEPSLLPRSGDVVPADTQLRIGFASPPVLGGTGTIRIVRTADRQVVDTIAPGTETIEIGVAAQGLVRRVKHEPVRVRGNSVVIVPHRGKLAANTEYEVQIDASLLRLPLSKRWTFRTGPAATAATALTVDDDGPASFRTIQGALDHVMQLASPGPATIHIRNGRYEELLYLRGRDQLTLKGESRDGVVIHATNNDAMNAGTGTGQPPGSEKPSGGRAVMLIEAADLLTLDTLTFENNTLRTIGTGAQAETIHFNVDNGRLVARNATFFSEQDTVQLKGYAWFYQTLIAGNVDFIWGANRAALFEQSELRTIGDSAQRNPGGWLVQARTLTESDKGFVFLNSRLTHGPGPLGHPVTPGSAYLARSPGRPAMWDNVIFINCAMGEHIAPEGWARSGLNKQPPPNPAVASATSGWREFGSTDLAGKPLDLSARAGYRMTPEEAARHFPDRAAVFAAFDNGRGWNPQP